MNFLKAIRNFFKGKKTYIAALLLVIAGFIQEDYQLVLEGVSIAALRAGIKNA